jgi:hypothetical protein
LAVLKWRQHEVGASELAASQVAGDTRFSSGN